MEIGNVTSAAIALASANIQDAVGIAALKKALDIQANSAAALLTAVPAVNLPPHLGQNINTTA